MKHNEEADAEERDAVRGLEESMETIKDDLCSNYATKVHSPHSTNLLCSLIRGCVVG